METGSKNTATIKAVRNLKTIVVRIVRDQYSLSGARLVVCLGRRESAGMAETDAFRAIRRARPLRSTHKMQGARSDACRMRNAAIVGLALLASSAAACPPRHGGFKVFQALLYAGMPELSRRGVAQAHVIDRGFWLGRDQSGFADEAKVSAIVNALPQDGAPIVIDIELPELRYNYTDKAASLRAQPKIRELAQIAAQFKAASGKRAVGFYGIFPLSDYWRAIDNPAGGFHDWQRNNDDLAPIDAHVDVTFPSLYTYYRDRAGWVKQANALVCEARRISSKPVYAFIRPEFMESTVDAGRDLPRDYWQLELETLYGIADGIVIWGGYDVAADHPKSWDEAAPWWNVTQTLIKKWRLAPPISAVSKRDAAA